MRRDLLKAIASAKDVTNAVVLTHNIDFVFLQTVVLSALRRCGHPKLTIFADAQCAAESYGHQAPLLEGLGSRYRVVPIAMAPGYRFHPKALLLSSEKAASLWVGSGNLTFGGWRDNAEIWVEYDSIKDIGAFAAFKSYLTQTLTRVPLRDSVAVEIAEAFDPGSKPWAEDLDDEDESALVGRVGHGAALLDQLTTEQTTADHIAVCAPYFDPEGAALRALQERAKRVSVFCQPRTTTLTKEAVRACGKHLEVNAVDFHREREDDTPTSAFLHAKFISFTHGNRSTVFVGSANCSKAALLATGSTGNAELMARHDLSAAAFREAYLSELTKDENEVELPSREELDETRETLPALQILAARHEAGTLSAAFIPARATVAQCLVDTVAMKFSVSHPGQLVTRSSGEPRQLVLEATLDGQVHRSAPVWIDHELHLSTSARARSVADAIRNHVRPDKWSAGAWAEVMEVFCKHLTYLPTRSYAARPTHKKEGGDDEKVFPFEDVFATGYRPPSLVVKDVTASQSATDRSLQSLLFHWFGISTDDQSADDGSSHPGEGDEDEDVVDRPQQLRDLIPKKKAQFKPAPDLDPRRLERIIEQIDSAMLSEDFLEQRSPAMLAGDLKFASVLLRVGLREHWLPQDRFFYLTFRIWSALFFSGSPEPNKGWIEYRVSQAENRQSFAAPLCTPEVAAALIGWALAVPDDAPAPELARFELACALAVARLPWLWSGADRAAVERELKTLLTQTSPRKVAANTLLAAAAKVWADMVRRGQALMHLEQALAQVTPATLRSKVRQSRLRAGEILWQGRSGFCVVLRDALRVEGAEVRVLPLQGVLATTKYQGPFTIPLANLLDEESAQDTGIKLKGPQRRVLRDFLDDIATKLRPLSREYDFDEED